MSRKLPVWKTRVADELEPLNGVVPPDAVVIAVDVPPTGLSPPGPANQKLFTKLLKLGWLPAPVPAVPSQL